MFGYPVGCDVEPPFLYVAPHLLQLSQKKVGDIYFFIKKSSGIFWGGGRICQKYDMNKETYFFLWMFGCGVGEGEVCRVSIYV